MIYHFKECDYKEVFEDNQYPVLHHVCQMELKRGQSFQAMHSHNNRVEIIYILEGEGIHTIGSSTYDTQEGDLLVFNADTPHEEKFRGEKPLTFCSCAIKELKIKGRRKNQLVLDHQIPVIKCGENRGWISSVFQLLLQESTSGTELSPTLCGYLASVLVMKVLELSRDSEDASSGKESELVKQAKDYLDENYLNKITVKDISDLLFVSPFYLERIFKKNVGFSLNQYVINRKLGHAQILLTDTDDSVVKIAELVGYDNPGYFNQLFKKKFGITPGTYRKFLGKIVSGDKKGQENNI
ncbi:AraC family transcriptional regulator [Anaerostipes sp.]|uniref:AraC family transcriptional regulator n=1 Tax=Anaerostipes sp. TaxID=1872530 RepID=UPI0025C33D37|nr:AraC family transcriptional regulator [Anaerostipes sp.]MBS7009882.1 AraC family transcriptional regulator [Anaerostipes sp.]